MDQENNFNLPEDLDFDCFDIDKLLFDNEANWLHNEEERLKSFSFWIISDVSKEKLACAGFYHVKEDHVQCFECNVLIGNWSRGDDPFIEHFKHSTECLFIRGEQTKNVPINRETLIKELSELNSINWEICQTTKILKASDIHHPRYKTVEQRMQTFNNWPKGLSQTPIELSRAGFFYLGTSDEVKCFTCGKCLKGWEKNDVPYEEHKRHFWQDCRFIRDYYNACKNKSNQKVSGKASSEQIKCLLDYMKQEPDFANGIINISNDKKKFHSMWDVLTEKLNDLGPANKSAKMWREVWRNVKYNRKQGAKRSHSSQSIESSTSSSAEDYVSQAFQTSHKILVLDPNIDAEKYHQQDFSINSTYIEILKLERDVKSRQLEVAKANLELLQKQQLICNSSLQNLR